MASSSYVVKVQYEGAIRRLTLQPGKELVFSYAQLQSRTRDLFQVPTTAQLLLTYIDSDGDVVTMADDQDLQDALVMQSLNPLRINMTVIKGKSDIKSNSSVTHDQEQWKSDTNFEERTTTSGETAAKETPAPTVQEEVINDGGDVASGSNSSDDKQENADDLKESTAEKSATDDKLRSPDDGKPENAVDLKESTAEKGATDDKLRSPDVGKPENAVDLKESAAEKGGTDENLKGPEVANAVAGEDGFQRDIHHGVQCDGCGMVPLVGPRFKSCKKANYDLCLRCFEASGAGQNEYVRIDQRCYHLAHPAFFGKMMRLSPALASRNVNPGQDLNSTSVSAADANKDKAASAPAKEEKKGADPKPMVHCGVQCNECGVIPVQGPRFKPRTRFNYDLCLACFEKSGSNAKEYSRLDEPVPNRGCNYPPVMGTMIGRLVVPNYRVGFWTKC